MIELLSITMYPRHCLFWSVCSVTVLSLKNILKYKRRKDIDFDVKLLEVI